VSVSVLSGPATSSGTNGTTITPTGIGTVTLTASQGGSANYLAAPMITNSFAVLQATQSIAPFAGISNIAYSTSPVTVTLPVASSGLTVSLLASGSATNNGNLLTLLGVGTVTLTARQAGNSNYLAAAPEITNFVISQATQIIASFSIGDQTYGNPPFNVTPPTGGGSGNPVVLSILSGPATIVSNTITITGAGNVVVAADQSGNSNYSAANEVTSGFNVAQATQTITPFTRIPNQSGFSPLTITPPVSSSGLPVTVSVISGNATILGNVVTPTNSPATIELAANQPGNSNYLAASQVTTIFSAGKSDQTIAAFGSIPNQTYGTSPLNVTPPAASSALPVVLSVLSGPATISGNKVSLTGVGTVVLAADQSGNATYGPADEVTTSFNVTQGSQVIGAFNTIGSQVYGTPVTITPPAASSGLPVSVSVLSGPATILGDVVTPTGVGTVTIAANQTGNPDYLAASQVTTSFAIAQASQSIGAFSIPDQTYGNAPFSVTPPEGGGSDNPVTLSILSGPATISNNVITITGTGNVTVAANQVGNSNYTAASQVTTSFTIAQESQNIAPFPTIPPQKRTKKLDMYTITPPTASSGLPVNVSVLSGPATISGDVLTLTAKGVVTLAANQAGNTNYLAAPQQTISFPVNLKSQSIKLSGIKNGDQIAYTPKALHIATASSELPVALAVTSGPAIVSGERLFIDGVGTVTVTLNQAGNSIYYEAPEVTLTFTVNPANQTIMPIVISSSIKFSNTPVRVPIPKTSSGLPASFSIVSGPASVSGNEITLTGTGEVVLKASQGGNSDYLPVSETISFKVH